MQHNAAVPQKFPVETYLLSSYDGTKAQDQQDTEDTLGEYISDQMVIYKDLLGGDDKVAKGPELVQRLKADLIKSFGGQKKKTKVKT